MVSIDMEMPSCCMNCGVLGKEEMYCSLYPRRDLDIITVATGRPDWCPLVEIEERKVGKWIYKKLGVRTFGIVCSNCNRVYYEGQNIGSLEEFKSDVERIMHERNVTLDEYCCHCGTEMVGTEDE